MHSNNPVVYILTLKTSGMFYIGSTQNFDRRLKEHFSSLKNNCHHNKLLQKAWFNDEKICFSLIPMSTRQECYDFEDALIKSLSKSNCSNKLTNIGLSALGGDNLTRHPDRNEIIEKITITSNNIFNSMTPEYRKEKYGRIGEKNGMFGKTHTPEVRRVLSLVNKGIVRRSGFKLSDKQKKSLSDYAKTRIGNKNPFFGKKHSDETINRLRLVRKGQKPTNMRKLIAGGILFNSCADAARHYKISQGLITYRVKNQKMKDWYYYDEQAISNENC